MFTFPNPKARRHRVDLPTYDACQWICLHDGDANGRLFLGIEVLPVD